jgi:hypothetical protein
LRAWRSRLLCGACRGASRSQRLDDVLHHLLRVGKQHHGIIAESAISLSIAFFGEKQYFVLMGIVTENETNTGSERADPGTKREVAALSPYLEEEARERRSTMIWKSSAILIGALTFAIVGYAVSADINTLLGDWRPGVLVLAGVALLFTYVVRLQLAVQNKIKIEKLEQLHKFNLELAERIHRRMSNGSPARRG